MAEPVLTIIAPDLKPEMRTGGALYTDTVIAELRKAGVPFRLLRLPVWDFRLGPFHAGYHPRLLYYQLTVRPRGIVHTFLPQIVPPTTRIVTIQSMGIGHPNPLTNFIFQRARRALLRYPRFYVGVSEASKRGIMADLGLPADRLRIAPSGVDTETFRPGAGPRPAAFEANKIVLLHVGHGLPRKGVHLLVEALGHLDAGRFQLVRAGPPTDAAYVARYTARARELGVQVTECGYIPQTSLPPYYGNADLLVFPTSAEGASLTPLEAMACGTNLVLSDIPPNREVGEGVATFAPLEAAGLADAIRDALDHRRSPDVLRERALRYSWARTAQTYIDIYREVGAV